jgi:hypothetical protein
MPKFDRNVSYGGRTDDADVTDPKISTLHHSISATSTRKRFMLDASLVGPGDHT